MKKILACAAPFFICLFLWLVISAVPSYAEEDLSSGQETIAYGDNTELSDTMGQTESDTFLPEDAGETGAQKEDFSAREEYSAGESIREPAPPVNIVIIGDSYSEGYIPVDDIYPYVKAWPSIFAEQMDNANVALYTRGGSGFVNTVGNINFQSLLNRAYSETVSPDEVDILIVCGGYNDFWYDMYTIYSKAVSFLQKAKAYYPNAEILIGMIGWNSAEDWIQDRIWGQVLPAYKQAAMDAGARYIANCEYVLQNTQNAFSVDYIHPAEAGQNAIGSHIYTFITNYKSDKAHITVRYHVPTENGYDVTEIVYSCGDDIILPGDPDIMASGDILGWTRTPKFFNVEYYANTTQSAAWFAENYPVVDLYAILQSYSDGEGKELRYSESTGRWIYMVEGSEDTSFAGLFLYKDRGFYIENGMLNTGYTGLIPDGGERLYIRNGLFDTDSAGIISSGNSLLYVKGGRVDFTHNGAELYINGWLKITNGWVDLSYTGFADNITGWFYFEAGSQAKGVSRVIYGKANVSGLKKGFNGWWFVENGQVSGKDTVAQNEYGWWKITYGLVDFNYTGLVQNEYGWWRIENGKVNFSFNGLCMYNNTWYYLRGGCIDGEFHGLTQGRDGVWYYINGGYIDWSVTTLTYYNGYWFYVNRGSIDWGYTGLAQNEYGWWRIENGKVNFNFNGLCMYNNTWYYLRGGCIDWGFHGLTQGWDGIWYYINGGKINFGYYGLAQGWDGVWYYINGGYIDWSVTTLTYYNGHWFYVNRGSIDWGYTGLAQNEYGWWFVRNGVIDFSFNGRVTNAAGTWNVINGHVVF